MADKPYSFRMDKPSQLSLRTALEHYLAENEADNKSQQLINLVKDALIEKGYFSEEGRQSTQDAIAELRNEINDRIEQRVETSRRTIEDFVRNLLKDTERIATINRASESIANGEEIGDDILQNILEGLE